ncbi:sigma 54-interacting transcriptional regulator [Nitratidesulfovibrio sp. SRB-5]|uniref:sigma 54-interacting transcriptional regulator n=1 Tax=Nitratidesulfovibrio sp. SRB-5 TaxID=2872636 RepID=UPI001025740D|nr:sigma 54-interacting transcriptional regulator [Nitratidesulfovibrio sp. SRB-5]MBZ2172967.1 sigma 54-interacting transcriptional regulator [Nitratidesulfovibrio sp. SRB-5]RXF78498.1 AAA family ATPase [Desulfovibrio sp. DS-1]
MASILMIGYQADLYAHLSRLLVREGHTLHLASSFDEGVEYCDSFQCCLVVLEEGVVPVMSVAISTLRSMSASPHVVVVSERYDANFGQEVILGGALNYMQKGTAPRAICALISHLPGISADENHVSSFREFGIYGSSAKLQVQLSIISRSRSADVNVLLQGETGTGKELFAKAIHRMSPRKDGPLITVDCASLPEHLVESLLLGYSQGAFTGAARSRVGLIKQADGGTLFLDEVGELPLALQKKFLRVLHERRYRPVGGGKEETSNFRLVAATNRDLQEMVRLGTFRDDLLYRIGTMKVLLPPLRERGADVIEIAEHLLEARAAANGGSPRQMSADFKARLLAYPWPGNIRELVNVIDCTLAVATDGDVLFAEHLPATIHAGMLQASNHAWSGPRQGAAHRRDGMAQGPAVVDDDARLHSGEDIAVSISRPHVIPSFREAKREAMESFERTYLSKLYAEAQGNVHNACALSNLSRARLYELMRKYDLLN